MLCEAEVSQAMLFGGEKPGPSLEQSSSEHEKGMATLSLGTEKTRL